MNDVSLAPVFFEVAVLVLMAAALGLVGVLLRQPLVVAFIAAGVLAGPDVLGLVQSEAFIALLSKISIAVLLFLVGMKLDVTLIRSLGAVAVVAGVGQMALTTALGYALALALGLEPMAAFYVALALAFSSTIIIVKLLSDKHEIDALHGRIALGILISFFSNFFLNRSITFADSDEQNLWRQLVGFAGACSVGALANLIIAQAVLYFRPAWPIQVAVLFGVACGFVFNFIINRFHVFKRTTVRPPSHSDEN